MFKSKNKKVMYTACKPQFHYMQVWLSLFTRTCENAVVQRYSHDVHPGMCNVTCVKDCVCLICCLTSTVIN